MIKKIVLLFTLIFFSCYCYSQQSAIVMTYDGAGNRKTRKTVVMLSTRGISPNVVNEESNFESELLGDREIRIWPNPTKGALRITIEGRKPEGNILLRLFGLNGVLLLQNTFSDSEYIADLSALDYGTYLLVVTIEGTNKEFKVIKE